MKKKNNFLRCTAAGLLFLMLLGGIRPVLADELAALDGRHYEGLIINQSPYDVTIRTKNGKITLKRSDLKYIKKWSRQENDVLAGEWKASSGGTRDSRARDEELKYADSVKYSDKPWQIYEEDAFIAFHRNEGIIKSRLKGKVGDYCKKVADKLGYEEFKIYDKSASPNWGLKFKFYSYRSFETWKKALEAIGEDPARVAAFASGNRRVAFYELYMREDFIYHEIVHEIYRELTKGASVPRWWNEGVGQFALLTTNDARRYISESRFRALSNKQISLSSGDDSREHNYEDGLSVVYFLVREKGKDKFKKFNYNLRDKKRFEDSLSEVYGFKDINALEKAWVEYLKKTDVKDIATD